MRRLALGLFFTLLVCTIGVTRVNAQLTSDDPLVGTWVGWAEPEYKFQAPFLQVRIQVTFFSDGTAYWNDGHELIFGHRTGHGQWTKPTADTFRSTFVLMGMDTTSASGSGNNLKIRFSGKISPIGQDNLTGDVNLTIFPPGTDPLDASDAGGFGAFGTFKIKSMRRVRLDPPGFTDISDVKNNPQDEYAMGAFFGLAVPAPDNTNPPFPSVVMMINFNSDGNVMATDSFEEAAPHITAHGGPWIRTTDELRTTFVWTNMDATSDYQGYAKVRITATLDSTLDVAVGTVRPTGFARGVDVLDLNDAAPFSGFLGQFDIKELTRIKVDPAEPTIVGRDYTNNLPTGAWYGKATADNPGLAGMTDIDIMPHFLPSGMVMWNDSWELAKHHGTGFGDWKPTGGDGNGVKAVGVLEQFDGTKSNQFGGAYKLKFAGNVSPGDPNNMTGSFELVYFPVSAIPLPSPDPTQVFHRDSTDTGGISLGTFTITSLKRIQDQPLPGPRPGPPSTAGQNTGNVYIDEEPIVGTWVGYLEPERQFQAPFDQVRIQVTFFKNGTGYWNDGHEKAFAHRTGHGTWSRTSGNNMEASFILMGFDTTSVSGSGSSLKIRLNGQLNPTSVDNLTGEVTLTVFSGGADPTSPTDAGGVPLFGIFKITSLRRVKLDPPGCTDLADTKNHPENEVGLGAWFGKAVPRRDPDDPPPPFPNVVMMINLNDDRNVMATDSFEESAPHTTAHGGPWIRTADEVRTTFVWTNENNTTDYQGYAKVRITATVDSTKDVMVGTVRPTGIAPGVDVLDLNDAAPFSQFLGQFNIVELTRIKADPVAPTVVGQNYSNRLPTGAWYGTATADNPSIAPFPEIVMMTNFLPSGMVMWNDSWEIREPHGTGFGNWMPTGSDTNGVKGIVVMEQYDLTKANNFGGAYKLRFSGQVSPSNPNKMTGQINLVYFPESAIPLPSPDPKKVFHRDSTDVGGTSLGTYTFTNLRRIGNLKQGPTGIDESGEVQPPKAFSLGDAYPNPFNPSTTIRFNMPVGAPVTITVYNVAGQFVKELVNRQLPAGHHEFVWDGTDSHNIQVASGVYFYQINIAGFKVSKKVSLLK